jgi:RimJ/RimL family protein N-acetyltransferase
MPQAVGVAPSTIDRIDAYWSAYLECLLDDLRERRTTVVAHGRALAGYDGVYALRACEGGLVVSAPAAYAGDLYRALRDRPMRATFIPAFLGSALHDDARAITGPASLAYTDGDALIAQRNLHWTRQLTVDDAAALAQLRASCDPGEWAQAGIEPGRGPIVACFDSATMVAAGSWEARGPLRHIGVISHPSCRGNGYATAVAVALTTAAIREGAIPQWQTLIANAPSRAVGLKLGFVERYRSMAIRLP